MSAPRVTLVTALTPESNGAVEPATGVLTLASILRPQYETQLVEVNLIWNNVNRQSAEFHRAASEAIVNTGSDIIGFTSICGTYPTTIRLACNVAERLPNSHIVLGGPHASVVDVQTLTAFPCLDAVIRGEAEQTFPQFISALGSEKSLDQLSGLTFRKGRRVQRNPNGSVITDLDALPLPAFDLHPGIEDLQVFPFEIGRGCPFACTFCSTNDFFRRNFRLKTARHAVEQMRSLQSRYGVSHFDLIHDMFTVDRRRVVEFCQEITRKGSGFTWSCSARTDRVDLELLTQMRDAGCRGIFFGIETGSPRLQRVIDKRLDLDEARRVVQMCDSLGIRNTNSLIAGYPTETMEDFKDTVEFLSSVSRFPLAEPQIHILAPLPQTPLTTQYLNEIYFDPDGVDDAESGMLQDPVDRLLIAAHNDIFLNFGAFPCPIDRNFVRRAANFLTYGLLKCNGLMLALHQHTGDLLGVFERWDQNNRDKRPPYFESWEFASDLVDFAEREFGADHDTALVVTTRFYRAFQTSFGVTTRNPPPGSEERLALRSSVFLVTVEGDILRVLEDLRNERRPDRSCLDRTVTVIVRQEGEQQCTVAELPRISSVLLQYAQVGASVSDVYADFERLELSFGPLTPAEVALHAINSLEADNLIRRVPAI